MSSMINRVANYQVSLGTQANRLKSLVGVVQLNSGESLEKNFEDIAKATEACVGRGAKIICLPDRFAYQPGKNSIDWSENPDTGKWFKKYQQLALENCVWMSLGGFPEQHPTLQNRHWSTHYIINDEGKVQSSYRKMHTFVAEL